MNLLTGIAAKLSAAGVAAKAGVGLAVAAASVSGAAAVGVLPEAPASDPVTTVTTSVDASVNDTVEDNDEAPAPAGDDGFGASVSADASDPESPGVDGAEISQRARELGGQHRPADPGSQGLSRAGETPAAEHRPESVPGGPSTGEQYRPETPVAGAPEEPPTAPEETETAPEETPVSPTEETPAGPPAELPGGKP